jgi:hypothetical protein
MDLRRWRCDRRACRLVADEVGPSPVVTTTLSSVIDWKFVIPQSIAALTAGAAMFGAIAAWRAARASERTSRDALVALAIAIKPRINVDTLDMHGANRSRSIALIQNTSEWDAIDVEVEVRLRDGSVVEDTTAVLKTAQTAVGLPTGADFEVEFGEPAPDETHASRLDRVLVRYWDSRKIRRYEYRQIWTLATKREGSVTSVLEGMHREEDQIAGP